MEYESTCSCGGVAIQLSLPEAIERYTPRQCDCDFCLSHNLSYLSDPHGSFTITTCGVLNRLRQGSGQAAFLQCPDCLQVVAVTCQYETRTQDTGSTETEIKGAVSSALFAASFHMAPSETVSPKYLDASEKRGRWLAHWAVVTLKENA
jgi:hypothetical protein